MYYLNMLPIDLRIQIRFTKILLNYHSSKILLLIILNRLTPQTENILSEEQAGFRKNISTTEQISNCRLIME